MRAIRVHFAKSKCPIECCFYRIQCSLSNISYALIISLKIVQTFHTRFVLRHYPLRMAFLRMSPCRAVTVGIVVEVIISNFFSGKRKYTYIVIVRPAICCVPLVRPNIVVSPLSYTAIFAQDFDVSGEQAWWASRGSGFDCRCYCSRRLGEALLTFCLLPNASLFIAGGPALTPTGIRVCFFYRK